MTTSPDTQPARPAVGARHLPLPGTFNVRDAGGYPTVDESRIRWGTLLRADSLHNLDDVGRELLITTYSLRTVVDLRSATETTRWPNAFANSIVPSYRHMPLTATPAEVLYDLEAIYRRYIDTAHAEIAAVLAALAESDALPAVVHCMAGKDRTGLIVALILAVAGVPHETIAEDYALTAMYLTDDYFAESLNRAVVYGLDPDRYAGLRVCPPEFMLNTLGYIEAQHGSVIDYVRTIGLSTEQIAALRSALRDDEAVA